MGRFHYKAIALSHMAVFKITTTFLVTSQPFYRLRKLTRENATECGLQLRVAERANVHHFIGHRAS